MQELQLESQGLTVLENTGITVQVLQQQFIPNFCTGKNIDGLPVNNNKIDGVPVQVYLQAPGLVNDYVNTVVFGPNLF